MAEIDATERDPIADAKSIYIWGGGIFAVVSFFGLWIVSMMEWGFWGVCFGWIPASFGAGIIGLTWPVWAIALMFAVNYINHH